MPHQKARNINNVAENNKKNEKKRELNKKLKKWNNRLSQGEKKAKKLNGEFLKEMNTHMIKT